MEKLRAPDINVLLEDLKLSDTQTSSSASSSSPAGARTFSKKPQKLKQKICYNIFGMPNISEIHELEPKKRFKSRIPVYCGKTSRRKPEEERPKIKRTSLEKESWPVVHLPKKGCFCHYVRQYLSQIEFLYKRDRESPARAKAPFEIRAVYSSNVVLILFFLCLVGFFVFLCLVGFFFCLQSIGLIKGILN